MSLRIYICCKQVPDVAMPFQIKKGQLIKERTKLYLERLRRFLR